MKETKIIILSYGQSNFKDFKTIKSMGFNQETKIFIIVLSLEKNLKNTAIFIKLCAV